MSRQDESIEEQSALDSSSVSAPNTRTSLDHQSPRKMIRRLVSPPGLFTGENASGWSTTQWLEAFFDLVFGVAISQLAELFDPTITFSRTLLFAALFLPFWWIWLGNVVYGLRFGNDNLLYRLGTFVQVLAVAAMTIQVPEATGPGSSGFAVAYLVSRATLLLLYLIAGFYTPRAREAVNVYLLGFGMGLLCWLISLFVPPPVRFLLWGLGLLIDLLTPWIGRPRLQHFPVDTKHLPERLGIFITIILGQSILAAITGVTQVHWLPISSTTAVLLFGLMAVIWWNYFSYYELAQPIEHLGSGQPYIYTHLPFVLGVAFVSASVSNIIKAAAQPHLDAPTLWLLIGGTLLWIIGYWAIQVITIRSDFHSTVHLMTGVGLLVTIIIGAAGLFLPPVLTVTLLFVAQLTILIGKYLLLAHLEERMEAQRH